MANIIIKRKVISTLLIIVVLVTLVVFSLGCSTLSYLAQAASGHLRIMRARVPIEKVLLSDELDSISRNRLQLVLDVRKFATNVLALPDNKSYTVFAQLDEDYPGWNIFAAPPYSLTPKTWCYPVAGCVVYHGYFNKEKAFKSAEEIKNEGYEVYVSPFTAYSTLGWFKDPILSTHLRYDSARLAGLIIHEMAHQQFYYPKDSKVSESFAVTVERAGVLRWLESLKRPDQMKQVRNHWDNNESFAKRMLEAKETLQAIYTEHDDSLVMQLKKNALFDQLSQESGINRERLNNAFFVPISTYETLVPELTALLDSCGGDFAEFYTRIEQKFR